MHWIHTAVKLECGLSDSVIIKYNVAPFGDYSLSSLPTLLAPINQIVVKIYQG